MAVLKGIKRTLQSIKNRVDDARDAWIDRQDRWAFRYFNDVPILLDELRKATENRGREKRGPK